jgi:hypothetical protein
MSQLLSAASPIFNLDLDRVKAVTGVLCVNFIPLSHDLSGQPL